MLGIDECAISNLTRWQRFGVIELVLQIHTEQVGAFREAYFVLFIDEMARHMRHVLPDQVQHIDDEALVISLDRRLRAALALEITDRFDILRYLECSYVLGWDDEGPDEDARGVFLQEGLLLGEKLDLIEQRTIPR